MSLMHRAFRRGIRRSSFLRPVSLSSSTTFARTFSSSTDEVQLLQTLLQEAINRQEMQSTAEATEKSTSTGAKFNVATFNAISPVGLAEFESDRYYVKDMESMLAEGIEPHCIMLRSHKLKLEEVPPSVRCVARCGAGTNNVPSVDLAKLGVPVFNTPGANANAVKEAVVCGLLLASRGIYEGIRHTADVIYSETDSHAEASARIEKDKKFFVGRELTGKTLGVIGLGHIGGKVVESGLNLGMKTIGYDPALSLDAAWRLPGDRMQRAEDLETLLRESDYISLHVPYMPATHHLLSSAELDLMKTNASIINFSRGELVDSEALRNRYDQGTFTGKYVSDFADEHMQGHPKMIMLPHLGASTGEAEENSAAMAATTIKDFLTQGCVVNSVNFPAASLPLKDNTVRLCIVNHNTPGTLGGISTELGKLGLNIAQQLNTSRTDVAYTMLDIEGADLEPDAIMATLGEIPGVMSCRFIGYGPGTNFRIYPGNHRSD